MNYETIQRIVFSILVSRNYQEPRRMTIMMMRVKVTMMMIMSMMMKMPFFRLQDEDVRLPIRWARGGVVGGRGTKSSAESAV